MLGHLAGKRYPRESPQFEASCNWLKLVNKWQIPEDLRKELVSSLCLTFQVSQQELLSEINGVVKAPPVPTPRPRTHVSDEAALRKLIPKDGWFDWYDQYTRETESPLSYHLFSSLAILSAALGRRVYLDMGFWKVYPNLCLVLVGPTGRVAKTSAVTIAKDIIQQFTLCPIMSDQPTPQKMMTNLARDGGHHFIYAPEFSVFLDKSKFNESMCSKILRLLDCPDEFTVDTESRGEEVISNVAITFLGASTPDQLGVSTPKDVVRSGFVNRFLWLLEDDTERCFARPRKGPVKFEQKIFETVERLKSWTGEADFKPEAWELYESWYKERKLSLRGIKEEFVAEAMQRGADHMLRLAMLISLAEYDTLRIPLEAIQLAIALLKYVEDKVPSLILAFKQNSQNTDTDFVLSVLEKLGGETDHSTLLQRCVHRYGNAQRFKEAIKTLEEMGSILITNRKGLAVRYTLRKEKS